MTSTTSRLSCAVFAALVWVLACGPSAAAAVPVDFLGPIGAFPYSPYTSWQSSYKGEDYSFADNGWASNADKNGWRYGSDKSTSNDAVAVGWFRQSNASVNPAKNIVFQIQSGSTNFQFFAIKDLIPAGFVNLVSDISSKNFHVWPEPGDVLELQVDQCQVISSGPTAQVSHPTIEMELLGSSASGKSQTLIKASLAYQAGGPFMRRVTIRGSYASFRVIFHIGASNIAESEVGLRLSGVHLGMFKHSQTTYATEDIPSPSNRSIKTFLPFYSPSDMPMKEAADDFDYIMLKQESDCWMIPWLKYYNPSVKVYLYESCRVSDWSSGGVDAFFSGSPLGFQYVKNAHPGWLYAGSNGFLHSQTYGNSYFAHLPNLDYQRAWATATIDKATREHFDGVFIDDAIDSTQRMSDGRVVEPQISPADVQSFVHYVVSALRSAGLQTIQNGCTRDRTTMPGELYYAPRSR